MTASQSPRHALAPRQLSVLQRKPRRLSVTLNQATYERLQAMSDEQGRSLSNLSAYLLEAATRD